MLKWWKGMEHLTYKIDHSDGILTFTIDREDKRNAVNDEVMNGFKENCKHILMKIMMFVF